MAGPGEGVAERPADRIRLLGLDFDRVTAAQAVDRICEAAERGEGGWAVTPNLDILRRFADDREFARLCGETTLRLADGMPIVWASRLQGTPLPERVPGSDLIFSLSAGAGRSGLRIFLLGGNPGTAEAAGEELMRRSPGLVVAGTHCPPFGFEGEPDRIAEMTAALTGARPDLVFVALGSPKQERLIRSLREILPDAWFLGVGISFSFVCGDVRRAPRWMQRTGLEWVHRLAQEPGRLARRYLLEDLPFALRLAGSALRTRIRRRFS